MAEKLTEILGESNDMLTEYVMVMVGNEKDMPSVEKDLEELIGEGSARIFAHWLGECLAGKLNAAESIKAPAAQREARGSKDEEGAVPGVVKAPPSRGAPPAVSEAEKRKASGFLKALADAGADRSGKANSRGQPRGRPERGAESGNRGKKQNIADRLGEKVPEKVVLDEDGYPLVEGFDDLSADVGRGAGKRKAWESKETEDEEGAGAKRPAGKGKGKGWNPSWGVAWVWAPFPAGGELIGLGEVLIYFLSFSSPPRHHNLNCERVRQGQRSCWKRQGQGVQERHVHSARILVCQERGGGLRWGPRCWRRCGGLGRGCAR